ncbi:hypothetical protein Tco_0882086 [Tanacetum coccineum]
METIDKRNTGQRIALLTLTLQCLKLAFASKHLHIANADCICTLHLYIAFAACICKKAFDIALAHCYFAANIWDNEDVHDLGSVETEFPAIVFTDTLTSKTALLCEPTPTVSCFDDLDFFNDFENEFPAIVYNNSQTSKSNLLTEPILSPQHIDEFNLKDETSLSECDEEEQNVLNFNDLFPFNVIYPNDSKSDKDNDDDKVDIEHSSGDLSIKSLPDVINIDVGAYAQGSISFWK